jgi:excisionase family DNA binding protein
MSEGKINPLQFRELAMPSPQYRNNLAIVEQLERIDHALTVKELAPILSMSETKLYDMARAGRIPSYRIGGGVRFDPRAVARWLESKAIVVPGLPQMPSRVVEPADSR